MKNYKNIVKSIQIIKINKNKEILVLIFYLKIKIIKIRKWRILATLLIDKSSNKKNRI